MCGIAGWIEGRGGTVSRERLLAAAEAQRHRGPDHAGVWVDTSSESSTGWSVGLAAVRLAIQDPRPQAHQPLTDPHGRFVIVYNGELYNAAELRTRLSRKGWTFRTSGDTEVVLAVCALWGVDGLTRLNGMFALAFLDRQQQRGFLARDPWGIKPLLYVVSGPRLIFASEMCGLTALGGFDRALNPSALSHLLTFGYIAHPETIYSAARRLAPGEVLEFDAATGPARPRRFIWISIEGKQPWGSPDHPADLRYAIRRAVLRQRVSDVPLGCFLSGGVDSSIVAFHLSEVSTTPVRTFTIGYADQGTFDESGFARRVARHLGTDHIELRLTHQDVLNVIPSVLDHLHEPFGDSSIIPTTLVSHLARRHVTVVLSGDGADELFGGYWRYQAHAAADAYRRLPGWLRSGIIEPWLAMYASGKSSAGMDRIRQWRKLLRGCQGEHDVLSRHLAWARILSPDAEPLLRCPGLLRETLNQTLERWRSMAAETGASCEGINAVLVADMQYGLAGDMLHKVDLASMSCSLEVRVPFLDPRVASLALAMPFERKIDRGMRKRALVDAYRGLLPDDILDRPKRGFEVPFGEYLRGPLLGMFRDVVTRATVDALEYVDYDAVLRLLESHLARRQDHGDLLFTLLSLCWWRARRDTA